MSVCGYLMRHWDAPVPLVTVILFLPVFALAGFRVAAHRRLDAGGLAGAAAAVTGYLIVCSVAIGYSALTDPWPKPLIWVGFLAVFLLPAASLGMLSGMAGAMLARSITRPVNG
jgi:hypothetical protein